MAAQIKITTQLLVITSCSLVANHAGSYRCNSVRRFSCDFPSFSSNYSIDASAKHQKLFLFTLTTLWWFVYPYYWNSLFNSDKAFVIRFVMHHGIMEFIHEISGDYAPSRFLSAFKTIMTHFIMNRNASQLLLDVKINEAGKQKRKFKYFSLCSL